MKINPIHKVVLNLPLTGNIEMLSEMKSSAQFFDNIFEITGKDSDFFIIENKDIKLKVDEEAIHSFVDVEPNTSVNFDIWKKIF